MPKTISSTEAQSQFGSILKWAKENNDEVIQETLRMDEQLAES